MYEQNREKAIVLSVLMTVILVGVILGVQLDPNVRAKQVEAFGDAPLGLSAPLVSVVGELLLFLPVPLFLYHGIVVILYEQSQGIRTRGVFSFLGAAASASRVERKLKRSALIAVMGLFYVMAVFGAWIVYADSKGI